MTTKKFTFKTEGEYFLSTGSKSVAGTVVPGKTLGYRGGSNHEDMVEYATRYFKSMYPKTNVSSVTIREEGGETKVFKF